jgi:uncharacterized membrane protein YecN with MAPEG domain
MDTVELFIALASAVLLPVAFLGLVLLAGRIAFAYEQHRRALVSARRNRNRNRNRN